MNTVHSLVSRSFSLLFQNNPAKYQQLLSRCEVAVPIFHAYAHKASCQYKYSPRNLEGFGLHDGENIERLWSYIGKFSRMTKEMSCANRIDLLTDALMHYSSIKQENLGKFEFAVYNVFLHVCT